MSGELVNVDNFARAETNRMFSALLRDAGGLNRWHHNRQVAPLDHQPVIRMNRDTLYSMAIVDLAEGALLTVPDGGRRYVSVMVVNQDHYINAVFHDPGDHELTMADFDTRYVMLGAWVLVDPADPTDLASVNALQDQLGVRAGSRSPSSCPTTTTPASPRPVGPSWSWPRASAASTTRSAPRTTWTRSAT